MHRSADRLRANVPRAPVHVPEDLVVVGERVHRAEHVVGDSVRLAPAHGAIGVADLDDLVGAGIAECESDRLLGRIRHRADLEAIDPQMRVVPAVPNGDVPEDAVLLLRSEVHIDRLDDVERRVVLDRYVRREPLDDPALVGESRRCERDRQRNGDDRGG